MHAQGGHDFYVKYPKWFTDKVQTFLKEKWCIISKWSCFVSEAYSSTLVRTHQEVPQIQKRFSFYWLRFLYHARYCSRFLNFFFQGFLCILLYNYMSICRRNCFMRILWSINGFTYSLFNYRVQVSRDVESQEQTLINTKRPHPHATNSFWTVCLCCGSVATKYKLSLSKPKAAATECAILLGV